MVHDAIIASSTVIEKNVLFDVTNTPTLNKADKDKKVLSGHHQVAKVRASPNLNRKMPASVKGKNGVSNSKLPAVTPDDRIQGDKCCIQRRQLSQQHKTPTSELRSVQENNDYATEEASTSRQSSTEKCKTADDRQQVDERPTLKEAGMKVRQITDLTISAKAPLNIEYAVVPDFRANIYGTASTIQLHDDATAASTPLATASATQRSTDGDSAQPATTSPYKDNDFSKDKGDIDIGNKLPVASSNC